MRVLATGRYIRKPNVSRREARGHGKIAPWTPLPHYLCIREGHKRRGGQQSTKRGIFWKIRDTSGRDVAQPSHCSGFYLVRTLVMAVRAQSFCLGGPPEMHFGLFFGLEKSTPFHFPFSSLGRTYITTGRHLSAQCIFLHQLQCVLAETAEKIK